MIRIVISVLIAGPQTGVNVCRRLCAGMEHVCPLAGWTIRPNSFSRMGLSVRTSWSGVCSAAFVDLGVGACAGAA